MGGSKIGNKFKLITTYQPSGDQPKAIDQIMDNFIHGIKNQVLLGVTGSGKTFTMACVIEKIQEPTLILAPNKTLAAQLYSEFKTLFPQNAVEYFVSYYDYYQPEAYLPATDTYIEKDSSINEQIDRMRHSATRSLFDRKDVIIVSSVSCIYGLGSPEAYENMMIHLRVGTDLKRDSFLRELARIRYYRSDIDFHRGTFRVRGDCVEIFPPYEEERALRVEFFGDFIDKLSWVDPLRGKTLAPLDLIAIYPGSHYVNTQEKLKQGMHLIQEELRERIQVLNDEIKHLEAKRLEQRTLCDIEMLEEIGFCPGIENYSRHFTGRKTGEPPPTLIEYFPKKFLTIIDESHITIPQIGGMYRGDRARKSTLVEHGFRLPSALDNRPLNFEEFESYVEKVIFVSATPSEYELKKSEGHIIEQIIRPTGLLDPEIVVKPAKNQVDDLLGEVRKRTKLNERVLVTTLTKRSSEDLTDYYSSLGIKVKYLHSDIKTVERTEILRDLRIGIFDVLIGINLLREGLDLPEVSLVAITDADKEGFLRSERSLIQTIGRAARNDHGQVIMYADMMTESMKKAINETQRRRQIQFEYNQKNNITPETIKKKIHDSLDTVYNFDYSTPQIHSINEKLEQKYGDDIKKLTKEISQLKQKMKKASQNLEFETAAQIRDQIKRLEVFELELRSGLTSENSEAHGSN